MVHCVILAGGAGRRIGGEKAFVRLDGQALIHWAIDALQPQVAALAISGEGDQLANIGLPLLPDADGASGPSAGLMAALSWAQAASAPGLLVTPCDMPFLPPTLVDELSAPDCVCVPQIGDRPLWALSYWPAVCLEKTSSLLARAQSGAKGVSLRSLIHEQPYRSVPMSNADDFFGINTASALVQAQAIARSRRKPAQ